MARECRAGPKIIDQTLDAARLLFGVSFGVLSRSVSCFFPRITQVLWRKLLLFQSKFGAEVDYFTEMRGIFFRRKASLLRMKAASLVSPRDFK